MSRFRSLLLLEITSARLTLVLLCIALMAAATLLRTPLLTFGAAALAATPLVVGALARWGGRSLRLSRRLPTTALVGDPVRVQLRVVNTGTWPSLLVHLRPVMAQSGAGRASRAHLQIGRRDESEIYPCTPDVLNGGRDLVVPILGPGQEFSGEVVLRATRRGVWRLPGAGAGALDPLGLSQAFGARSAEAELTVCPRPLPLPRLSLGVGIGGEPGPQLGPAVSDATDLHGVRPHRPGEGVRRVHWGATARSGQLHVVEWEEEVASQGFVLLDVARSAMAGPPGDDTLEASITAAASVAAHLLEQARPVQLFWWQKDGAGLRVHRVAARHRAGLSSVLEALARIAPVESEEATLSTLAASARLRADNAGEGVLLLGSDRSDWSGTLRAWGGVGNSTRGRSGNRASLRALAWECDSFKVRRGASTNDSQRFACFAARPEHQTADASSSVRKSVSRNVPQGVRLVRRGESLSRILERDT